LLSGSFVDRRFVMTPRRTAAAAALLFSLVLPNEGRAADYLGGQRVYTASEMCRTIKSHPAYSLCSTGKTWWKSASERAKQGKAYSTYAATNLPSYEGQKMDCANVALDCLSGFCKTQGLRLALKVWVPQKGYRYIDSAGFQSFSGFQTFLKNFVGAHGITDNAKLIRPLSSFKTPDDWAKLVRPGDLLMWSYNHASSTDPTRPGRPTTVGHTQPIMEVQAGSALDSTFLKVMNGNIHLATGEPLSAFSSSEWVSSLKPVEAGHSLSNYPTESLYKVMQKYDSSKPIAEGEAPQAGQGPLRWSVF
jgi:hypothetical protein